MGSSFKYKLLLLLIIAGFLIPGKQLHAQENIRDTILSYAVIYDGDTIEAKTLPALGFYSRLTEQQRLDRAKWTRLRNAIYVTYPYARRAGSVMNDINAHLVSITNNDERKKYIQSREKELKKEF